MLQWRKNYLGISYSSSPFATAVFTNGEKNYFGIYLYKSSQLAIAMYLYSSSQLAIAVYTNGENNYFGIYLCRSSTLAIAVCTNGKKNHFGIYYIGALSSPLLHTAMARTWSVYIQDMLFRHSCKQQWHGDFSIYIVS